MNPRLRAAIRVLLLLILGVGLLLLFPRAQCRGSEWPRVICGIFGG